MEITGKVLFIFKEFLPVTYKLGLIKTLIDGTSEINNTWTGFQTDLQKFLSSYGRISSLRTLSTNAFLNIFRHQSMEEKHRSLTLSTSQSQQRWICKLAHQLCKPIDIRSGFTSFKIKKLVNVEKVVPEGLRTPVVYKFSCASCNACFVGKTSQHFSTRIRKHLFSDRSSNVFRHLQSSGACRPSCTRDCFVILDSAATEF